MKDIGTAFSIVIGLCAVIVTAGAAVVVVSIVHITRSAKAT